MASKLVKLSVSVRVTDAASGEQRYEPAWEAGPTLAREEDIERAFRRAADAFDELCAEELVGDVVQPVAPASSETTEAPQ